jgi:hypothetical protein
MLELLEEVGFSRAIVNALDKSSLEPLMQDITTTSRADALFKLHYKRGEAEACIEVVTRALQNKCVPTLTKHLKSIINQKPSFISTHFDDILNAITPTDQEWRTLLLTHQLSTIPRHPLHNSLDRYTNFALRLGASARISDALLLECCSNYKAADIIWLFGVPFVTPSQDGHVAAYMALERRGIEQFRGMDMSLFELKFGGL